VFGKVIGQDSMLVVRKIENVATGKSHPPVLSNVCADHVAGVRRTKQSTEIGLHGYG